MKNLVTVRQDRHYEWADSFRMSSAKKQFNSWVEKKNNLRRIDGEKPLKYPYLDRESQDYLYDLYFDLRSKRKIICDFRTFYNKVIEPFEVRCYRPEKKETTKYVKNTEHSKKTKSDQQLSKEEWREYKGFKMDKGKVERRSSGRKYWRKKKRRWIRQEVRQKLKHEEYDDINRGNDRVDGWLWD